MMRVKAWEGVRKVFFQVARERLEARVASKAFLDLCAERG